MMSALAVAFGAAAGALARWQLGLWLNPRHASLPLGTLAVNVVGGLLIGMAMVLNLLVAATVGVLTPLTLSRLKFDPAVSSAVFVTATTDFFGFLIFLGLATLVLL